MVSADRYGFLNTYMSSPGIMHVGFLYRTSWHIWVSWLHIWVSLQDILTTWVSPDCMSFLPRDIWLHMSFSTGQWKLHIWRVFYRTSDYIWVSPDHVVLWHIWVSALHMVVDYIWVSPDYGFLLTTYEFLRLHVVLLTAYEFYHDYIWVSPDPMWFLPNYIWGFSWLWVSPDYIWFVLFALWVSPDFMWVLLTTYEFLLTWFIHTFIPVS
jgi:hypothetical protein